MGFSKEDIITILSAGGVISADVAGMAKNDLLEIASLALKVDSVVTFRNLGSLSVDDLVEIVKAGGDSVKLVL